METSQDENKSKNGEEVVIKELKSKKSILKIFATKNLTNNHLSKNDSKEVLFNKFNEQITLPSINSSIPTSN